MILREGICPGINEDFIKALQSEDIRTGVDFEHHTDTCSFKFILMALTRNAKVLQWLYGVKPTILFLMSGLFTVRLCWALLYCVGNI